MFDNAEEHAWHADVDAVNGAAVGLERQVDAGHRFADDAKIRRIGEGYTSRAKTGIGGNAGEIAEAFRIAAVIEHNIAVLRVALVCRHAHRLGAGIDQHHTRGGAGRAQRAVAAARGAAAAGEINDRHGLERAGIDDDRKRYAPAGAVHRRVRLEHRDLIPGGAQFFGDDLRQPGHAPLAELATAEQNRNAIVRADANVSVELIVAGSIGFAEQAIFAHVKTQAKAAETADRRDQKIAPRPTFILTRFRR